MTTILSVSTILDASISSTSNTTQNNAESSLFLNCLQGLQTELSGDASLEHNSIVGIKQLSLTFNPPSTVSTGSGASSTLPGPITISGVIAETHEINGKAVLENDSFSYTQYGLAPGQPSEASNFEIEHPNSDLTDQSSASGNTMPSNATTESPDISQNEYAQKQFEAIIASISNATKEISISFSESEQTELLKL